MHDRFELPAGLWIAEHGPRKQCAIDAAVRLEKDLSELRGDGVCRWRAGPEGLMHDLVSVYGGNTSVLQPREHVTFARRNATGESDLQRRNSAALMVFAISIAMVSGPTPPGTGVRAPATSPTSGCTSPTSTEPLRSKSPRRGCPS